MNHALNHKAIAEKVYEGAEIRIGSNGKVYVEECFFSLLEMEGNVPTQQARASALDVLLWLNKELDRKHGYAVYTCNSAYKDDNPCAAIYKAACGALKLEDV